VVAIVAVETAEEDTMENRDSGPAPAGIDFTAAGFSAAVRNLQVFAEEIGRVSRSSFEQNAKLIDDLSAAREVGDIVAIQTKFMTGMIETFNEQVRLMMSRMANFPLGAANLGESFTWARADLARTAEKAVEPAAATTSEAGLEPQPNGAAGATSDTHAGSEPGADSPPAEAEAPKITAEAVEPAAEPEPTTAADVTSASEDTLVATTAYAAFTTTQEGEELGKAEVDAAQKEEQSAAEATQRAAKASREAWQELAKAAAELLRAEPSPGEPDDAETSDTPQRSDAGDHRV
jgi:hypothetical protein